MKTQNTIVAAAVLAVNEDLMKSLIADAKPLVSRLDSVRLGIESLEKQVTEHYKELVSLAGSRIDDSFLASVPAGASKDTVLAVIDKMNKDKQAQVEISAKNITAAIDALQVRIANEKKTQETLVKQLLDLKPRTVTLPASAE